MTITTKDVETRLRTALETTIPQLLSDDTQLRGSTEQPATSSEELLVLAPARSEASESRSGAPGWRLIGAAAAGVILVGGLTIAQRQQGDPAPVAQAPTPPATAVAVPRPAVADLPAPALRPDVFPVIPDTYQNADLVSAVWGGPIGGTGAVPAEGLVALVDGDTISNALQLSVVSETAGAPYAPAATAQVAGLDVEIYVENGTPTFTTVVLPGSPALAVTGQDPIGFIEDAGGFPIDGARIDSNGNATFAVGDLPAGYEVIVPPSQLPVGSVNAAIRFPVGNDLAIWADVRNPLINWAQAGQLRQVDINGTLGWTTDSGPRAFVIWPASPTTWAMISGATNADLAVDLARTVTFVDEATWSERYEVEAGPSPTPADQTDADVVATTTTMVK